jgi:hypothetical protein
MNMFRLPIALFAALLFVAPAAGQDAKLKNELKAKEAAAKKDPELLFEAGKWANEKALVTDAKRLFQAVLKIKPDHAGANEALGNALVEGKWLPAKEAETLRKKALAAEYSAKGLVEVNGVWVEKDKVDDAKRGVFHFEQDVVTKDELVALQSGKVRHPETGELIDPKNLEKAKSGYFPVGSDRWVDLKEADLWHSETKRPWIVRTKDGLFVSTLALAKIQELKPKIDEALERVRPLFGNRVLAGTHRPVVFVAATQSEYTEMSTALGDGTDACGTFLVRDEATMALPFLGEVRPAICFNEKNWAPNYVRHCAALSYAHGVAEEAGVDLPLWFLHGAGSYASRFLTDEEAGGFAKQFLKRGNMRGLKPFFAGFAISGEMDANDIQYNIFQAGLLLSFALHGGEPKVTETMQAVTACLAGGGKGNFDKLLTKLQGQLIECEPKVAAYFQQLAAKAQ